jgi:hypothetical protein
MLTAQIPLPDFGDEHWNAYALVALLFFVVIAMFLRFSLFTVSKICLAICDWFDCATARRRKRQRSLRQRSQEQPVTNGVVIIERDLRTNAPNNRPKKVSNAASHRTRRTVGAREALRRNAEGAINHFEH